MFRNTKAFSGFSVGDLQKAKHFYGQVLGLEVTETDMGFLELHITGGSKIMVYPKPNHVPATFTILNFPVKDIDQAVDGLAAKGVTFERYDTSKMKADEKGVYRAAMTGQGPNIAWFKDPSGNILSILEKQVDKKRVMP